MSKTRHIEWHETRKCQYKFWTNIYNNKQRWNKDQCRCEGKELIDKGVRDKGFIWNHSYCECECDKACNVGEYLGYENCKCSKKLVAPLINECTEAVEEVNLAKKTLAENENSYKCKSCTVHIVLKVVFLQFVQELVLILFITVGLWLKIIFRALSLVPGLRQQFTKHINGQSQTN